MNAFIHHFLFEFRTGIRNKQLLLMNYLFGLWIADPIVGLIIVGFLGREGYELLFEEDEAKDNR